MEISSSFSLIQDCPTLLSFGLYDGNDKKRSFPGLEDDVNDPSIQEFVSGFLAFDGSNDDDNPAQEHQSSFLVDSNVSRPTKQRCLEPEEFSSATNGGGVTQRRLWVKSRSKAWWEQVNSPDFPESEFKNCFGMSKSTFDLICKELESVVTKKDTMLRSAIPVRQRVAVCIWRLSRGEALREVSKRFGLGISTCHKLVLEVSSAIRTVLMPKFLQWPDDPHRMMKIKKDFELISGIPNICGSMYTTHVPIIAPKENVGVYFNKRHTKRNQKPSYTVTVQGVVDPNGIFTDISLGWPGSLSDGQILEKSALSKRAKMGSLNDSWIVGASGHPLMDWLLVPYSKPNLSWTQHAYNERIQCVQSIVKDAFWKLKARWRCLQKRTEMKLQDLPLVLCACCVLHNMCEIRNEDLNQNQSSPPQNLLDEDDDETIAANCVVAAEAMSARDRIARKLLHQNDLNQIQPV